MWSLFTGNVIFCVLFQLLVTHELHGRHRLNIPLVYVGHLACFARGFRLFLVLHLRHALLLIAKVLFLNQSQGFVNIAPVDRVLINQGSQHSTNFVEPIGVLGLLFFELFDRMGEFVLELDEVFFFDFAFLVLV